jgi:hypothetical protein
MAILIFLSGLVIGCGFAGLILLRQQSKDISKLFEAIKFLESEGYPFLREDLERHYNN